MQYYAIKMTDENRCMIEKFTDAFEHDYEDYARGIWFFYPVYRPWKSWFTANSYTIRNRFPEMDQDIHIQVVDE